MGTTSLKKNMALSLETYPLCAKMARLRNKYAHGQGLNPKEDALKSLKWLHAFTENETSLMRNYAIVHGMLVRKHDLPD